VRAGSAKYAGALRVSVGPAGTPGERTFAERLDHLFATVHPEGRRPYSLDEVAAAITDRGPEPISANYIWMLRKGIRDNPTKRHIEALADFFGVPAAYFLDSEVAVRVDSQLELLAKMRDAGAQYIGLRSEELSPESREAIAKMIDTASEVFVKMIDGAATLSTAGHSGRR
jgi:transcriptional regulator with XRE-family HTH domain